MSQEQMITLRRMLAELGVGDPRRPGILARLRALDLQCSLDTVLQNNEITKRKYPNESKANS